MPVPAEENSNMTRGHASRRARGFKGRKETAPKFSPVNVTKAHPMAWEHALELAGGDVSRCVPQDDGSVIIYNHPQR
jgi:hypothetical protein